MSDFSNSSLRLRVGSQPTSVDVDLVDVINSEEEVIMYNGDHIPASGTPFRAVACAIDDTISVRLPFLTGRYTFSMKVNGTHLTIDLVSEYVDQASFHLLGDRLVFVAYSLGWGVAAGSQLNMTASGDVSGVINVAAEEGAGAFVTLTFRAW